MARGICVYPAIFTAMKGGYHRAEKQHGFTRVIEDRLVHERYSAKVTVRKKLPVRTSLQPGKIDLADFLITPVSAQPWDTVHNHFVLYDAAGNGLHIVRDRTNKDEQRIPCTIWDLGRSFATRVLAALKALA
jgi:hypothetical protein